MPPVITGMGFVSSLGRDIATAFDAFCRGEPALRPLRAFDASLYRVTRAYEIADQPADAHDAPRRASGWLREAIAQALGQAGMDPAGLAPAATPGRCPVPVIVGTGLAEQRSLELWHTAGAALTLDELHFGGVAAELGLTKSITLLNACSAGLFALAVAADLLALGEAQAVVVAAGDAITESMFGLLDRVSPDPPAEVRPFDADRRGVILGEGAAAIVLEQPGPAAGRGAIPLATLRGIATTCDAHHVTAPHQDGMARAFRDAHRRAGISPSQIDVIMAHGTGTMLNDATEAAALTGVFADAAGVPLVTALKSIIGHTSGASGLMSLVVAVHAMGAGLLPPTLNHRIPIKEAARLRIVAGAPRRAEIRTAQVEAFGFGGIDAVAILERPAGAGQRGPARTHRQAAAPAPGQPDPPVSRDLAVAVTGTGLAMPGVASVPDVLDRARGNTSLAAAGTPPDFDGSAVLGKYGLRYKDRATRLALCAVARALDDAGLAAPDSGSAASASFGVVVASSLGIADTICRVVERIHRDGAAATSPMDLPNVSANVTASSIAIWFHLAGHNLTVSSGPSSGVDAVYLAAAAIRAGRASRIVVVGVEPASQTAAALIRASTARHDPGTPPPGMLDGAAAIVLEAPGAARSRGAPQLAVLGGYAASGLLDDSAKVALACGHPDGERCDPDWAAGPPFWLGPCQRHPATQAAVALFAAGTTPTAGSADLSAVTGEASAALGVVQAAVAANWLTTRPGRRALISSGGCWGAGYASLVLWSGA